MAIAIKNPKTQNSFSIFLNNYFNIFLAVFLIIFLVIAYFLVIAPKYQTTLATIKDGITQKQMLRTAQQKKLANLKVISSLYKQISPSDLKKFNNVLSDNYVQERLFGEIEEIVNQNGLQINEIQISRPEDKATTNAAPGETPVAEVNPISPNLGEIDISLSLTAIDYMDFKNLIMIFETNLRLFDISQVNFSASAKTANITLKTYYYKKL